MEKIQDFSSEIKVKNESGLNKSDKDANGSDSEQEQKEGESKSYTDFEGDEHNLGDSSNDKV